MNGSPVQSASHSNVEFHHWLRVTNGDVHSTLLIRKADFLYLLICTYVCFARARKTGFAHV